MGVLKGLFLYLVLVSLNVCVFGRGINSINATCSAETCTTFTDSCSSNPDCTCYSTSKGVGFCGDVYSCNLPDCTNCDLSTSVCLVDTCCFAPICAAISDHEDCSDPPTVLSSRLNKLKKAKQFCKHDGECSTGTSCQSHTNGKYCV